MKRRKGKGKGKGKGQSSLKRIGNAYIGEELKRDNDWRTEEDSVWWSEEKGLSKGNNKFPEFDSRTFLQDTDSDKEFQSNKGTSTDQSRRGKESSYSQSGFSASESTSEKRRV